MDSVFNSHWFVRIIAFFIALMLFMMVNMDNFNNQSTGVLPALSSGSYTLEDVELVAYYDENQYAVTEMTDHVQVNLRGPQSVLTVLQVTRPSYEVYVDLRGKEAGVHHVSIQHDGFPSDLSVSIAPQFIRVVMQEKKTTSFPIDVDLVNEGEIAEDYSIGTPIVTPVNVEVTAAEEVINQVAIAKAYVDVRGGEKTVETGVPVKLYDHMGNELHLGDVDPSVVDVKVPITNPNTEVPIKVQRTGTLPEGQSIRSLTVEPKEVTIYGAANMINNISIVESEPLHLDTLLESQTVELALMQPPGAEKIEPEKVNVTVELDQEESVELLDVPVEIIGLPDQYELSVLGAKQPTVTVVVKGAKELLEKVDVDDVQVYIEVSQLPVGQHSVSVDVSGPQNLLFETDIANIEIEIKERAE